MNIRPLGDRLLVRLVEAEATTKGGIIVPDQAKEEKDEGVIVKVGREVMDPALVEGTHIVFGSFAGDNLIEDKTKYKLMVEDEVLAIIEEDTDEDKTHTFSDGDITTSTHDGTRIIGH